jgi:DNA-binding transcriptional regulator of glucitol operon
VTSQPSPGTGDTLDGVRQLILSPRWVLWHLLTLGAMATCLWLAAWQWQRAGSAMGSALNIGYGLQWPMFAVFFAFMWWRFLRMEIVQLKSAGRDGPRQGERRPEESAPEPEPMRAPLHGPNPFGPRPADARPAPIDEDSALAAYNRMLAELAARNPKD